MYYPINAFAGGAIPLSIAAAGFGVAELAGGVGNLNQALSPKVRSEFPETWVWESIIDNRYILIYVNCLMKYFSKIFLVLKLFLSV